MYQLKKQKYVNFSSKQTSIEKLHSKQEVNDSFMNITDTELLNKD